MSEIQVADYLTADCFKPERLNADLKMLQEWRAEAVARELPGLVDMIDGYIAATEMLINPTVH